MSKLIELEYEDVHNLGACTEAGDEYNTILLFASDMLDHIKEAVSMIEDDVTFAYADAAWYFDEEIECLCDMGEGHMSLFLEASIPDDRYTGLIGKHLEALANAADNDLTITRVLIE